MEAVEAEAVGEVGVEEDDEEEEEDDDEEGGCV